MSIGERIREARLQVPGKMTQQDLAEALYLNSMTVSRWERGLSTPSLRKVRQVAEVTGKTVEWFYESEVAA